MTDEPLRDHARVGQGFAREQRRQGIEGDGCADCGVRAPVRDMIGTGAARLRLCPECRMHREHAGLREQWWR